MASPVSDAVARLPNSFAIAVASSNLRVAIITGLLPFTKFLATVFPMFPKPITATFDVVIILFLFKF
ncbi:hypothetical protein D3C72_2168100 [compost metagenome]